MHLWTPIRHARFSSVHLGILEITFMTVFLKSKTKLFLQSEFKSPHLLSIHNIFRQSFHINEWKLSLDNDVNMAWPYLPFSQRKQTANLYCVSEGANSKMAYR